MGISISDSDISRELLLEIPDFNENTKKNITDADVLIVPKFFERRGQNLRRFPEGVSDFSKLATQELRDYSVRFCENEGDEGSYIQRSAIITIATLLISYVLLPLVVNFVSNYIYYKFLGRRKLDESTQSVSLEIIVEENGKFKKISYMGPVMGLEDIPSVYTKTIGENNDTNSL